MSGGQRSARALQESQETDESDDTDGTDDPPDTSGQTSPTQGQTSETNQTERTQQEVDAETDEAPDTSGQTSPTRGQSEETNVTERTQQETMQEAEVQEPPRTASQTSPTRGQANPGMGQVEGVSGSRVADIQQSVADETQGVYAPDVSVEREELSESEQQDLREQIAERENVDPSRVEFQETPFHLTASVSGGGEERAAETQVAAQYENVDPIEIDVDTETTEAEAITDEARIEIAAQETEYTTEELTVQDGDVMLRENASDEQQPSTEQVQGSIDPSEPVELSENSVANMDVNDPDRQMATRSTDRDFDVEEARGQGLAETLIDSGTAERISNTETIIPSDWVDDLQDAGAFVGRGEGSERAGIAGDIVGSGGLAGRGRGFGEFVTQPVDDTRAGSLAEDTIAGVTGEAPAAIAQAPGDAAALGERGVQATTLAINDPGRTGDILATAAGYGAAGAAGTASAVADDPATQGASLVALLGGTAAASQGVRTTTQAVRTRTTPRIRSMRSTVRELRADTRGTAQMPRQRRNEPERITGEDLTDPDTMGRHVPEQQYGEYELGPNQPTRLSGMTEDMGGRTGGASQRRQYAEQPQVYSEYELGPGQPTRLSGMTEGMGGHARGPLARQRQAQRQEVRLDQRALPFAGSAALVGSEIGRTRQAQRLATNQPTDEALLTNLRQTPRAVQSPVPDTSIRTTTQTAQDTISEQIATTTTTTQTNVPGDPGGDGGGRGGPGIPIPTLRLDDTARESDPLEMDLSFETDSDTGAYVDPLTGDFDL